MNLKVIIKNTSNNGNHGKVKGGNFPRDFNLQEMFHFSKQLAMGRRETGHTQQAAQD